MTTQAEGDAILDVFDYCATVTAAWNQRSLVTRNKKNAGKTLEKVSRAYSETRAQLADLFREAIMKGCDKTDVTAILMERLPTGVLRDIMTELD